MNDILYYESLADLFEADATYQDASTQVRFGYLIVAASFDWNLLKLLGNVSPTYHLARPAAGHDPTLVQLPYHNHSPTLHVKLAGISFNDGLEHRVGGIALKLSQDGEMSIFSNSENQATIFSPVW